MKLTEATLQAIEGPHPWATDAKPQNVSMDKGYDYPEVRQVVAQYGYTAHIVGAARSGRPRERYRGYRARRWVVERTHSWMNRFRRLLIRWEKKKANYLAMLHLACAWITFRAAGVVG